MMSGELTTPSIPRGMQPRQRWKMLARRPLSGALSSTARSTHNLQRQERVIPRKPNIPPTAELHVRIPAPLKAKLDLHLWSPLEGRIPVGAYQRFMVDLLNEHFSMDKPKLLELTDPREIKLVLEGQNNLGVPHAVVADKKVFVNPADMRAWRGS